MIGGAYGRVSAKYEMRSGVAHTCATYMYIRNAFWLTAEFRLILFAVALNKVWGSFVGKHLRVCVAAHGGMGTIKLLIEGAE